MYHTGGSDGVSSMREREWGHHWLLQAWGNLSANFWPELNTNIQTQHAAAAGENPEHCPALMQHFKTISKTSGAGFVRPCGGVGSKENNVKIIYSATMLCRGIGGTICGGIGHACVFSLVWSGSGYDCMYEGVKGRLCVWKHIDSLSDPYIGPQQWQTYSPWHCRNHLFNALLILHLAAHIKHEFASIWLHVNVNPHLIYNYKMKFNAPLTYKHQHQLIYNTCQLNYICMQIFAS